MRTLRALSLVIVAALLPATTLHAQPAKPSPKTAPSATVPAPPAPASSNDIVRLKSGTSFRGALVEHDPKGRTLLQTPEGTRDFDSNDVAYAGPAAGDTGPGGSAPPLPETTASAAPPVASTPVPPVSTPGPAASSAPPVTSSVAPSATGDVVQLEANAAGVQFHVLGGPLGARTLCAAPCSTQLPVGTYRMALSKGFASPQPVAGDVEVRANGTLVATYANHKSARVGGVLLIVGGSIVTLAGIGGLAGSGTESKALGSLGLLTGGGGLVAGILLVRKRDEASIRSAEADRVAPRGGFVSTAFATVPGPHLGGRF